MNDWNDTPEPSTPAALAFALAAFALKVASPYIGLALSTAWHYAANAAGLVL